MGSLGMPEILMILVIALIIFGPRKLPELGKTLGQSLAQFRLARGITSHCAEGGTSRAVI